VPEIRDRSMRLELITRNIRAASPGLGFSSEEIEACASRREFLEANEHEQAPEIRSLPPGFEFRSWLHPVSSSEIQST
jgi:hypothetical protein